MMNKIPFLLLLLLISCTNSKEKIHNKKLKAIEMMQYSKFDEAMPLFEEVIAMDENDAEAWYYLGNCYFGKDNTDKAMDCYNKAILINPNYALAYVNRGKLFKLRKDRDNACVNFLKAESLGITYLKEETKFCKDPGMDPTFATGNNSLIKDSL